MLLNKTLALLLLVITISYAVDITVTSCANSTTLLTNTTYTNATQFLTYENCQHGCINNNCLDSSQFINYAWLFILIIVIIISVCFIFLHKSNHDHFKNMFFFLILIFLSTICFVIGSLGESIGESIASAILSIGYIFGLLFVFFFAFYAWGFIKERLQRNEFDEEEMF